MPLGPLTVVPVCQSIEVVNESFGNGVVLEQHRFLGSVFVRNLPLDKLRICVAS